MKSMIRILSVLSASVMLAACATPHTEQQLNFTASALTKVSAAVDATVRYTQVPDGSIDVELLALSTSHDPSLLEPFRNFKVLVRRAGKFSEVLVCEPDGSKALLEDSGCTAKLDRHLWRDDPLARCEFSLDLEAVCKR